MRKRNIILSFLLFSIIVSAVEYTPLEKKLLERSIQDYWNHVYPPEVPRAFDVHREGCPVCGDGIKKHGSYSWIISPDKPFKVQCPECKNIFPDNDYEAYLKSGFKDKSLLTGKYVDDGYGWAPEPGAPKYWFVAYYNHWSFYQDTDPRGTDAVRLADAYARTGNEQFARCALAILDHFADYYEGYDYNKQSRYAIEIEPSYNGRMVNAIWESLLTNLMAEAYLETRDFLKQDDAELCAVTGKSSARIRENIENKLFRVVAKDIMSENGKNIGNFGMHQTTLLKIAKIFDDKAMARWVTDFRPSNRSESLPLDYALYNNIFGDGAPMESPGYNTHWTDCILSMFYQLRQNGIDEFKNHPISLHVVKYGSKLNICGNFVVSSGDSGSMVNRGHYVGRAASSELLYKMLPSTFTEYARHMCNGEYEEAAKSPEANVTYSSNLLPAYGMASLQNGNREHPTAVTLSFPNYVGHRHADVLDLGYFAENAALIPDFGYPNSASADDPMRFALYNNTLSHNTVVVNSKRQSYNSTSRITRYDTGAFAQYMIADAPDVYNIDKYRRGVLVCETAPGKTIVFDVFRVNGGSKHDWFMHSCGENFDTDIKLESQKGGTLAGETVEYGDFYDSPAHKNMKGARKNYMGYSGSGYQYLRNVKKGTAISGNIITLPAQACDSTEPLPGAALKLHMLGKNEIFFSEGEPPSTQLNKQKHVVFVTRRHSGKAPLNSVFGTVLESTSQGRENLDILKVDEINAGSGVVAARIQLKDGQVLYVFQSDKDVDFACDNIRFNGRAGALLLNNSENKGYSYVTGPGEIALGGRVVVRAGMPFTAKVTGIDFMAETISLDASVPAGLGNFFTIGKHAYRADGAKGNTVHLFEQSMLRGRGRIVSFEDIAHKRGRFTPMPSLAGKDMCIYTADNRFVAHILDKKHDGMMKFDRGLKKDTDYFISECGFGDNVTFPSSARSAFAIR